MPPLKKVDAGRLIAHIDRSWDTREDVRAHIDRWLPELKERARATHQALVALIDATMAAGPRS
jgi:hypothetical protein